MRLPFVVSNLLEELKKKCRNTCFFGGVQNVAGMLVVPNTSFSLLTQWSIMVSTMMLIILASLVALINFLDADMLIMVSWTFSISPDPKSFFYLITDKQFIPRFFRCNEA